MFLRQSINSLKYQECMVAQTQKTFKMAEIALVFDTNNNSICRHLEYPNKERFIAYAKELESWDNLYVSLKDGEVYTFRNYLLNLMEH
jgi:hypothetical protein